MVKFSGNVARMSKRDVNRILVVKLGRKRLLGRSRRRREDNIEMYLRDNTGWYGLDSSGSGCGLEEGSREHCNESSGSIKY
jgi:hypothetical protein